MLPELTVTHLELTTRYKKIQRTFELAHRDTQGVLHVILQTV